MHRPNIPYGRQELDEADRRAVLRVLEADFLTQGPEGPAFEQEVAQSVGATHAVATNSATSALHLACLALGLRTGKTLWTTPNTFVATANCALYCGAGIDFIDIHPETMNLDVGALADRLIRARRDDTLPQVVAPVDFAGLPADLDTISELAQEFGFRVLQDASHAIGATLKGRPIGRPGWADVVIFSFHPVKIITSAEGGMALTDDGALAQRMRDLRSHGITRDPQRFEGADPGPCHYEQWELGYNYRLTDLQAALGRSQWRKRETFVTARQAVADRYDPLLRDVIIERPGVFSDRQSSWHLYVVRARDELQQRHLLKRFHAAGVGASLHYPPIHLQPYYRRLGFGEGYCPRAESHSKRCVSLPMFPGLSEADQAHVIEVLRGSLGESLG